MSSSKLFSQGNTQSIITDPALSRRCKEMLIDRNNKVTLKQKIVTLIKRSEVLIEKSEKTKVTALAKLNRSLNKLKQEHSITELQIQTMEENIIKQGCPGITLQE